MCACCVPVCTCVPVRPPVRPIIRPSIRPSVRPSIRLNRRLCSTPTYLPHWWERKVRLRGTGDCVIPSLSEVSSSSFLRSFYFFLGLRVRARAYARTRMLRIRIECTEGRSPCRRILRKHYFVAIIVRRVLAYH